MNNLKKCILKDIADIKLSNVDKKTKENERSINLCNYTDVYKNAFINHNKSTSFMIATCNENEYKKFLLKKGQVAITKDSETRDDIGIPTYIEEDFNDVVLGYHLSLITPNENKLNGKFLNYWLNTKQAKRYFSNNAGGSGQRCSLPLDIIKSIPLMLPNISTQIKISNILFNIDKKIELNNQINQKLESMAKTLYDYWFVQFDFPDVDGKPYNSSGGKMVYSEELKRGIPLGWEVKELAQIENNIVTGKTPSTKKEEYYNGQVPFISIGDIRGNMYVVETENTLTQLGAESQIKKFIPKNSICVSCIASIGLIGFTTKDSQTNQQINSVVCNKFENRYFLYFALNDYFRFSGAKTGNTFANMNKQDFSEILITYPSKDTLVKFSNILKPSMEKIFNNSLENQKITQLRDWLLPMLMNGQVGVK